MRRQIKYNFGFLMGFLLLFLNAGFIELDKTMVLEFERKNYRIKSLSTLELNGKTNINSFNCLSNEKFPNNILSYSTVAGKPLTYFDEALLKIRIDQLDCGKKPINKDLFKALQGDMYPNIIIDLKEVEMFNPEGYDLSDCTNWIEFEAVTDVTITCKTLPVIIPIKVRQLDTDSYRIIGNTSVRLCDFDIEAPTALMGLIKVKDEIDINFDLYVDLE